MIVEWSGPALDDRIASIAFLRRSNPIVAKKTLLALVAASRGLADFPERGRVGIVPHTRELVTVPPYIIVYQIDVEAKKILILRLWHAAQDR